MYKNKIKSKTYLILLLLLTSCSYKSKEVKPKINPEINNELDQIGGTPVHIEHFKWYLKNYKKNERTK